MSSAVVPGRATPLNADPLGGVTMRAAAFVTVGLVLVLFLTVQVLGETVILRTAEADGSIQETRLWVVEYDGTAWLRSASDHGWFQRLKSNPEVELRRAGHWSVYMAVTSDSETERDAVNQRMAEKYGLADTLIGGVFDHSMPVVVRLEPR